MFEHLGLREIPKARTALVQRMLVGETRLANEQVIRLGFFLGIFALMVMWEVLAPRRVEPALRAATVGKQH